MKHPVMKVEKELQVIYVIKGEWITAWLQLGHEEEMVQVELRVLDTGEPEIFIRPEHMGCVKSFDDYYTPTGKKG